MDGRYKLQDKEQSNERPVVKAITWRSMRCWYPAVMDLTVFEAVEKAARLSHEMRESADLCCNLLARLYFPERREQHAPR